MLTVKNLFRFIIPIIIAAAFINGFELVESTITDDYTIDLPTEHNAYIDDCSIYDFDIYLPRQLSATNLLRLQNTSKRSNFSHNNQFKVIKASRIDGLDKRNYSQQKNLIIHYSFTRPFHRLISLGKLVI